MNCEVCQRRLLATRDPASPGPELRAHLADCPACRQWQRRLLRLEAHIPLLPVPRSHAKERLLDQLFGEPEPAPAPPPPVLKPRAPWWRSPHVVRRVAGAAAAAVLLVCGLLLGVLLQRGGGTPDNDALPPEVDQDLVARLADADVRLAEADTPRQRAEALADMAEALRQQRQAVRRAGDGGEETGELARLHERVVARARALPAAERRQVAAPANPPASPRTPAERLKELRGDLDLVRQLVEGGLRLAKEEDPLRRADQCNLLAKELSGAVRRAVKDRDRTRADVLGQQLEALLVRGVAANLQRAREQLPPDTPTPPELRRLADEAVSATDPLRQEFDQAPEHEQDRMSGVRQAVTQGRAHVEKAVGGPAGKGRGGLKAPPVGKKLKK